MTRTPSIPTTAADLSAEWTNDVLRHVGHQTSVASVQVEPIGTGQMASSLRVAITYQDPPTASLSAAPTSVVVTMASSDPASRAAGARGAYLREVRYYQELDRQLEVATPAMYWADVDVDTQDFALVLEDMHPANQGDQIDGCDPASVHLAAQNIAGLHAPFWCDESLYQLRWLTVPRDQRQASHLEAQGLIAMVTPGFIDRYRDRIDDDQVELLTWFGENSAAWLDDEHGSCFGLTHGDHRLDNLLFDPANAHRPVTVVDWQTVAVRNPVADISYLLGTSVEPEVRRQIEDDVVAGYHDRLGQLGVRDYSLDQCMQDYRQQTPHVLLLTVLGSMLTVQTNRGDDMFMAMLHRGSNQIFEHR